MQFTPTELVFIIVLGTAIFLLAPLFLLINFKEYNRRKQEALDEQRNMQLHFESELLKTHLEVQEQTMQTIATDLHDNIGQLLSLTTLTLNSINLAETEKSDRKINISLGLVNKSIKELRDLVKLLQGEQLLETGLGKAVKQELDRLKRIGGYKMNVNNQLLDSSIRAPKKDLIILRLLQEIINNIIKHAQASSIQVDLFLNDGMLFFTVAENGVGFDYEEVKKKNRGIGLFSIHKRIEMINGTIQISPNHPTGTTIAIEIPYP